jgi:hypothetical protein
MDFRTVNELIVSHICAWPQIATFVHLAASCGLFHPFQSPCVAWCLLGEVISPNCR